MSSITVSTGTGWFTKVKHEEGFLQLEFHGPTPQHVCAELDQRDHCAAGTLQALSRGLGFVLEDLKQWCCRALLSTEGLSPDVAGSAHLKRIAEIYKDRLILDNFEQYGSCRHMLRFFCTAETEKELAEAASAARKMHALLEELFSDSDSGHLKPGKAFKLSDQICKLLVCLRLEVSCQRKFEEIGSSPGKPETRKRGLLSVAAEEPGAKRRTAFNPEVGEWSSKDEEWNGFSDDGLADVSDASNDVAREGEGDDDDLRIVFCKLRPREDCLFRP